MKIVLIGIQGCGKGTLVLNLEKYLDFTLVSVGQALRDEIKTGSERGKTIKRIIDNGILVSDEIIMEVIKNKLSTCKQNVIFDGFPRTRVQADLLDKICKPDIVIYLKLSKQDAIKRVLDRVSCSKCGNITSKMLAKNMVCPICGSALSARNDDNIEALTKRFEQYETETFPLIERYKKQNILVEVDARASQKEVLNNVMKVLSDYNKK